MPSSRDDEPRGPSTALTFDEFFSELEAEARAEGPHAVQELSSLQRFFREEVRRGE